MATQKGREGGGGGGGVARVAEYGRIWAQVLSWFERERRNAEWRQQSRGGCFGVVQRAGA